MTLDSAQISAQGDPRWQAALEALAAVESLFDRVPGVVFFVKDRGGRYLLVNDTLVARCGAADRSELIGHTTDEVFPEPLGSRFRAQDLHVCRTGRAILQQLELHLYPTRSEGWCLTDKLPLRIGDGAVVGVVGTSRDLLATSSVRNGPAQVAAVLERVRSDLGGALTVGELAADAGLSVYQLNRRLRLLFGITAGQLITKARVDAASEMLRSSSRSIAEVAHACGYCDQSAFTRVFRRTVGLTPRQYRQRHRS